MAYLVHVVRILREQKSLLEQFEQFVCMLREQIFLGSDLEQFSFTQIHLEQFLSKDLLCKNLLCGKQIHSQGNGQFLRTPAIPSSFDYAEWLLTPAAHSATTGPSRRAYMSIQTIVAECQKP